MDQAPASAANHALEACERMLRPIMRLALAHGLKYQDLDNLIRELLLDEATQTWEQAHGKEPSGSQLSVTTGINRKEVKRRVDSNTQERAAAKVHSSLAAQVFAHWNFLVRTGEAAKELPIDSMEQELTTFAALARQNAKDVHYRSVLDELNRLKLVAETSGYVRLLAESFVPQDSNPDGLNLCAENSFAHMSAAVANVTGRQDPFLERAVWGVGVSAHDCKAIEVLARTLWSESRRQIYDAIARAPEATDPNDRHSIRVGTYTYFEPISQEAKNEA